MVTTDFNGLIDAIIGSDKQTASKLVKEYGDLRVKNAIEEDWKYFRRILNRTMSNRTRRLKNHILNYDEIAGAIELKEFTKYYASIEEELIREMAHGTDEVRHFAENLHDLMQSKLGNIKIDKRIIYEPQKPLEQ